MGHYHVMFKLLLPHTDIQEDVEDWIAYFCTISCADQQVSLSGMPL